MRPCVTEDGLPKRRYATRGEAFVDVEPVSRLSVDGRVQEYQCPKCGFWHLGHARGGRSAGGSAMVTAWKNGEIQVGIYHKVHVGCTLTEEGVLWSVDIETDVDGISVTACADTLPEAANRAAEALSAARAVRDLGDAVRADA